MGGDLLIDNASLLATCSGQGDATGKLGQIPEGVVLIRGGRILYAGPRSEAPPTGGIARLDAREGLVTPGYVDAHTHLLFAGERVDEFGMRCQGATYLEIAKAGGGIASTVRATRAASEDELVALARPRLRRLLEQGVTTAEAKSGYGLTLADELKMLRAIRTLDDEGPLSLIPTLLAAHAVPPEFSSARERYVDLCVEEIIPAAAEAHLARFCDAFVEQSAFTAAEGLRILSAGSALGLAPRLHANQLTDAGGAELAAACGAATADHLEHISMPGVAAMARAGVSAVLVPASTWYLGKPPYAPGRALVEAGVTLALGTNVNPGSAMSENLALTLTLACVGNGLTPDEAFYAATAGGAKALRLEDRGQLAPGRRGDVVVHACRQVGHLAYHAATPHARAVVVDGQVVFERELPELLTCFEVTPSRARGPSQRGADARPCCRGRPHGARG